ncbi:CdaR family protein [Saccharibacillus alkalitolerans]|uniref:YbbR domain-containing protein n=1 Tax=Saccharibacillus alkalitolerans TaxID=2705290 RepID=A0ABX0FCL7_9BACL|nr:CdaR family protein [Saccharibacillus alkalitolerans]NGZ77805.1 hypothetical protein [Saccharibacillus alkalitolerans]
MDKWLANNTAAKVIALAVAVILWAMVHVDTDAPTLTRTTQGNQTITNLAIEPYGFDSDKYVLQSIDPQRVSVEISGQRSQITSLLTNEYQVKMDLSSINEPGQYTVPLQFDPPSGVDLLSIEPSRVTVTIEEKVTQKFNAAILTTGTPAAGFTELDPVFEEGSEVQVTLPASEMKQVQKVQGEISVAGANENISGRVKLVAYSKNGEVLDDAVIEPSSIKVQIPVSSNVSSKTLPLNVSYSGKLPNGLVLSDVKAGAQQVTLYGAEGALDRVESYPPVTLDLSEITKEGATTYTKSLAAPSGVERIQPSSVSYTVTVVPYEKKVIRQVPVALTGQQEGTKAVITEPASGQMDVTIMGAPSLVSDVTVSDIKLTADLGGLGVGTHQVRLKVELPEYIETEGTSPPSVTVEIADIEEETETTPPAATEPETGKPSEPKPPSEGTDAGQGTGSENDASKQPPDQEEQGTDNPGNAPVTPEEPQPSESTAPDGVQPQPGEDSGNGSAETETAPEQSSDAGGGTQTP